MMARLEPKPNKMPKNALRKKKPTRRPQARPEYTRMEQAAKQTVTNRIHLCNLQRKEAAGGRFNKTVAGKTPSVKDADIKHLMRQYPMEAGSDDDHDVKQDDAAD